MVTTKLSEYGNGRCINCGFLGKRGKGALDSTCYHASLRERTTGELDRQYFETGLLTDTIPWCYANRADLFDEVQADANGRDYVVTSKEVISKDRDCQWWYPWREFATPKEHFDESLTLALEKQRQEFELELFNLSKDIQENSLKIQLASAEASAKTDRFNTKITWFFLILAVLQVAGAGIALFLPNGF